VFCLPFEERECYCAAPAARKAALSMASWRAVLPRGEPGDVSTVLDHRCRRTAEERVTTREA
jgi:hypothetical protein